MDTVVFENKEYTKASVLAKRFKYTSDYIGQLCRAGKVDARLVGRSWYVTLESVNQHRAGKYKKSADTSEKKSRKASNNYLSRIDVEPILNKKVVKILKDDNPVPVSVRYEADENILIPKIQRNPLSKSLPVDQADAEKLKISSSKTKEMLFKAEPPPEFVLSGSLNVTDYPNKEPVFSDKDSSGVTEQSLKQDKIVVPADNDLKTKTFTSSVKKTVTVKLQKRTNTSHIGTNGKASKNQTASKSFANQSRKATPLPSKQVIPNNFKPKSVKLRESGSSQLSRLSLTPFIAVFVAVVLSTLLVSISLEVEVSQSAYNSRLDIQVANLMAIISG